MKYSTEKTGIIIKSCREKQNMTQEKLGERIGVTGKQISNYEKGKLTPPTDILFSLCDVFECELGYLLGEEDYSEGTRFKTIVSQKTGLSSNAISSIIYIKEKETSWANFEKHKYSAILDKLLRSARLFDLIEAICKLDELYSKYEDQISIKKELEQSCQLSQKYQKVTLDKALNNWDIIGNEDNLPNFTDEEDEAIKNVNVMIDDLYNSDITISEIQSEMKYNKFLIQESLILLLSELYPM